jgi:hypothetical protein
LIVAITGHVEKEYVKKALDSGMDRVYSKPFPINEFGKLLINYNFIDSFPSNIKLDVHYD